MTLLAGYIVDQAAIMLLDQAGVEYPADELLAWVGDGQADIANLKPEAVSVNAAALLDPGARQVLPSTVARLVDVVCNLTAPAGVRYWGVSAIATPDSFLIDGLGGTDQALTFVQTRRFAPSGQYIYFAWPSGFGVPVFYVNGLLNSAWIKTVLSYAPLGGGGGRL